MAVAQVLTLLASAFIVSGQRPFFAGSRPIGFPELLNKTTTTPSGLEDKFGEVTTQRLPIEAQGDRDLVDRLSKLPIDKQPFWFINWQALEAERQKPQTYPQKPNPFLESNFQNTGTVPQTQNNFGVASFNSGSTNPKTASNAGNTGNTNSGNVQTPNWKLQGQEQLDNKSGNPNEDKPVPQTSTPGTTSTRIDISDTKTGNVDPKPITAKSDTDKPIIPNPVLVSKGLYAEENEFEDIQVKKSVNNNS